MCNPIFTLDNTYKVAMVIIAGTNVYFAHKFFNFKNTKEDIDKEKDRKINWLKTLILDHNLKHFYVFFDQIESELMKLNTPNLNDIEKQAIDETNAEFFITIRRKFTDIFLVVDKKIYSDVMNSFDNLQSNLTETIFNQGINLSYKPKFEDEIMSKVCATKTEIINKIFNYRG
jgi:hypothetical protein